MYSFVKLVKPKKKKKKTTTYTRPHDNNIPHYIHTHAAVVVENLIDLLVLLHVIYHYPCGHADNT